jgi:hypothetical protein
MSIIDWLDESVPNGGSKSNLGRVLDIAYNIEYGAECSQQSALNLVYLLGYQGAGTVPRLRQVEREVPRRRRQRSGRAAGFAEALGAQIQPDKALDRDQAQFHWDVHAQAFGGSSGHVRPRRARTALLAPARRSTTRKPGSSRSR